MKANKVNLFISPALFVFWYHSPNFLGTPRIYNQQLCISLAQNSLNVRFQTELLFLNYAKFNLLDVVKEMQNVLCEVGTKILNFNTVKIQTGHAMV